MKRIISLLISIILILSCSPKVNPDKSGGGERIGKTSILEDKNVEWEYFDESSIRPQNKIGIKDLQGLWEAYQGIYKFGEHQNRMQLEKPIIIEVKGNSYRRNLKSEFFEFAISENLILKKSETAVDTGIINKITKKDLTITWKDKSNYTRYYYKK